MDVFVGWVSFLIILGVFLWAIKTILMGISSLFTRQPPPPYVDARQVNIDQADFYGQIPDLREKDSRSTISNE